MMKWGMLMELRSGSGAPMLRAVTEPRQTKQTREELRAALLEAGREILLEEGLEPGSSNLTFKRAFDRVEKKTGLRLTNASVIRRVWEDQADYQAQALVALPTAQR